MANIDGYTKVSYDDYQAFLSGKDTSVQVVDCATFIYTYHHYLGETITIAKTFDGKCNFYIKSD